MAIRVWGAIFDQPPSSLPAEWNRWICVIVCVGLVRFAGRDEKRENLAQCTMQINLRNLSVGYSKRLHLESGRVLLHCINKFQSSVQCACILLFLAHASNCNGVCCVHRDGLRVGKLVRIWSLKGTCVQHACGAGGGRGRREVEECIFCSRSAFTAHYSQICSRRTGLLSILCLSNLNFANICNHTPTTKGLSECYIANNHDAGARHLFYWSTMETQIKYSRYVLGENLLEEWPWHCTRREPK